MPYNLGEMRGIFRQIEVAENFFPSRRSGQLHHMAPARPTAGVYADITRRRICGVPVIGIGSRPQKSIDMSTDRARIHFNGFLSAQ